MYLCLFSLYVTPCSGAKPLEGASPSFPRRRPRRCVARGLGAGSWALPFPGGLGQHLAARRLVFTGPASDLAKCCAPSGHCPPRTISNIYGFNPWVSCATEGSYAQDLVTFLSQLVFRTHLLDGSCTCAQQQQRRRRADFASREPGRCPRSSCLSG